MADMAKFERDRAAVRDPEPNQQTPQLKGRITYELRVEQDVNILAYFQGLNERGQQRYRDMDATGFQWWERPAVFLLPEDDAGPDVSGPLPWIGGATWHERVDVTEADLRVHLRTGYAHKVYGWNDTQWSEEDFDILRANVPWLDQFHTQLEGLDEDERTEEEARRPGPNDVPLEGLQ